MCYCFVILFESIYHLSQLEAKSWFNTSGIYGIGLMCELYHMIGWLPNGSHVVVKFL